MVQIIPIKTGIVKQGDDIATVIGNAADLQPDDIIIVSSKVIATAESAMINLESLQINAEAKDWSKKTGRSSQFCEAVLQETKRLNGTIISACPGALLTEVRPDGLGKGTILTANAGLDESNIAPGFAVGWPVDSVRSGSNLRMALEKKTSGRVAVIITDSCCHPRRLGVTAFALTVSGIDPFVNQIGKKDIFGKPLTITVEAIADQLATAGNMAMGNAGQQTPACIIREHGLALSDSEGWVDGIEPDEDLFRGII